ncbi:DHH family phosphoesterase [Effusibacillus dendaii]|uniref:DHH family phosphoesterase n=1 Tax=Effusibacillus dendaii TaxID=2743772 RepID=A0A7I8D5A9_9BACL|nr:bifunctional oligoribonuclease/PAP phosphatase NrnA [Effusibacillus dendaii]BCJ85308.1 DHH family phosphoesterase [Effusibacillus dendaii]
MEKNRMLQEAADFIRQNDRFLLVTHVQPDGDAFGSTLGFAHLLEALGKQVVIAAEEPVPGKFQFLPGSNKIQICSSISEKFSTVVALDCGDFRRLGSCADLLLPDAAVLNIDHHKTNDLFGKANLVDLDAAATSQIVYDLAGFLRVSVGLPMAICLYTGIMTDTGGFRYSNTTVAVHRIVGDLLEIGVAPYEIADRLLETLTWAQAQLIREALGTLQRDSSGQVAWIAVKRDLLDRLGARDEDVEGLVSYARNIQGVEVGILFREKEDGSVKVSLRSKYRVDVGQIALFYGGGGHARAAGCSLHSSIEQAQTDVLAKVSEWLAT